MTHIELPHPVQPIVSTRPSAEPFRFDTPSPDQTVIAKRSDSGMEMTKRRNVSHTVQHVSYQSREWRDFFSHTPHNKPIVGKDGETIRWRPLIRLSSICAQPFAEHPIPPPPPPPPKTNQRGEVLIPLSIQPPPRQRLGWPLKC